MSTIPWLKSFEVGNEAIDRDHRALIDGVNALEAALVAGDFVSANALCHGLRGRMRSHFEREERLLRDADFPRIREHVLTHATARHEIEGILDECRENCAGGLQIGCTSRWCVAVIRHVLMADLDFKSHLEER